MVVKLINSDNVEIWVQTNNTSGNDHPHNHHENDDDNDNDNDENDNIDKNGENYSKNGENDDIDNDDDEFSPLSKRAPSPNALWRIEARIVIFLVRNIIKFRLAMIIADWGWQW